jgi:SAM-dependent methyltransferase
VDRDLITGQGRARLEAAIDVATAEREADPLRRAEAVRGAVGDPGLAATAIAQADLRVRAVRKFGESARQMLFTASGLKQATRRELADHRARRYAAAAPESVLDLCCGIGSDLLAFSRAGLMATGVESDELTADIARANVAGRAAVVVGDAVNAGWRDAASVFIDPARRDTGGRTFDPASYSPSLDFVVDLLHAKRLAAAKVGPGLDHRLIPAGTEAEFVSWAGHRDGSGTSRDHGVKEAVLWSVGFSELTGSMISRRATVLPSGLSLTDVDPAEAAIGPIAEFIHEPDGTVIRAGLVQQAAALAGAHRIDAHLAYLSGDDPAPEWARTGHLIRSYRVQDVFPYSVKRLRTELSRRGIGIVEIKKRGIDIDPAALRRQLRPSGKHSITVVLARLADQRVAMLTEPV